MLADHLDATADVYSTSSELDEETLRRRDASARIHQGVACRVVRRGDRSIVRSDDGKILVDSTIIMATIDPPPDHGDELDVDGGPYAGRYIVEGPARIGRGQTVEYVAVSARRDATPAPRAPA